MKSVDLSTDRNLYIVNTLYDISCLGLNVLNFLMNWLIIPFLLMKVLLYVFFYFNWRMHYFSCRLLSGLGLSGTLGYLLSNLRSLKTLYKSFTLLHYSVLTFT